MRTPITILALVASAFASGRKPGAGRGNNERYFHITLTHWAEPSVCSKYGAYHSLEVISGGDCYDLEVPTMEFEIGFLQMYKDQKYDKYKGCNLRTFTGAGCTGSEGKIDDMAHDRVMEHHCFGPLAAPEKSVLLTCKSD